MNELSIVTYTTELYRVMPTPCSIPGCRSNRSRLDRSNSVFGFPKDPMRRTQWVWAIRKLYDSTYEYKEGFKICIRHFEDDLIEKEHRAIRDDGSLLVIPRKALSLRDGAVPTLFEFLPDPLPGGRYGRRRQPITDLSALRRELDVKIKEELVGLNVAYREELPALSIYKVEISDEFEPVVQFSATFNADLYTTVCHADVTASDLVRVLGEEQICNDWGKLQKLLQLLRGDRNSTKRKRLNIYSEDDVLILEVTDDGHIKLCDEIRSDSDDA